MINKKLIFLSKIPPQAAIFVHYVIILCVLCKFPAIFCRNVSYILVKLLQVNANFLTKQNTAAQFCINWQRLCFHLLFPTKHITQDTLNNTLLAVKLDMLLFCLVFHARLLRWFSKPAGRKLKEEEQHGTKLRFIHILGKLSVITTLKYIQNEYVLSKLCSNLKCYLKCLKVGSLWKNVNFL